MKGHVLRTLIVADARLLGRDPLLVWMTAVPIAMAILIRTIVRAVNEVAGSSVDLSPYYPVIMGGYLMSAPGMLGFVIGFLLLDERDSGTLRALRVTPLSMRHYLAYRSLGPLLAGVVSTSIGYPLAGISALPMTTLVPIAVVASLAAPLLALVLATAASNKVAGFAVVKILNAVNLLPIAAFFVPTPLQYAAGVLPTYWPMRALWSAAANQDDWPFLLAGTIVGVFAVVIAARALEHRLAATS
jgi:fluoroquinolone transport system permease protein